MIVLWVALVSAVAMGAFPPWKYISGSAERPAGYAFVLSEPPAPRSSNDYGNRYLAREFERVKVGVRLDTSRLLVQWILLALVAVGVTFALRGRPPRTAGEAIEDGGPDRGPIAPPIEDTPSGAEATDQNVAREQLRQYLMRRVAIAAERLRQARWESTSGDAPSLCGLLRRLWTFAVAGFRVDPWLYFLALVGGISFTFFDGFDRLVLDNPQGIAEAVGSVIGAWLACAVFAIVGSYQGWLLTRKSASGAFWGGVWVVLLAIVAAVHTGVVREWSRQQPAARQPMSAPGSTATALPVKGSAR